MPLASCIFTLVVVWRVLRPKTCIDICRSMTLLALCIVIQYIRCFSRHSMKILFSHSGIIWSSCIFSYGPYFNHYMIFMLIIVAAHLRSLRTTPIQRKHIPGVRINSKLAVISLEVLSHFITLLACTVVLTVKDHSRELL